MVYGALPARGERRTRNREIYDGFRKNFPLSEDLAEHIERR